MLKITYYRAIYGKIPEKEIENYLIACSNIRIKGFMNYDEVIRVMINSDLLVNSQEFSDYYQWDLKHSFYKRADHLAKWYVFFVYAPGKNASVRYFLDNNSACVVTRKKDLSESLRNLLWNKKLMYFILF